MMDAKHPRLYVGSCALTVNPQSVEGGYVEMLGETYYRIGHYDQMPRTHRVRPFFMSIVSSSDHWLFISSTGGLSAGRANAESALFPYYTDDKLTENASNTGHVAVLQVDMGNRIALWEPFSERHAGLYAVERNLYKNVAGDKLVFEEANHDLGLTYRYAWRTSDRYGFVMSGWLHNDTGDVRAIELVVGLQNLLPYGATTALQTAFSNLLNAYKRNELDPESGLGLFGLSSTLTDLAEPSESLKTTTVWQLGFDQPKVLLSTRQLLGFRQGSPVAGETDIRGYRGAYLVNTSLLLAGGEMRQWHIVADVNQGPCEVASLINLLKRHRAEEPTEDALAADLERTIAAGTEELVGIVAAADGLQLSADRMTTAHHFANVLFNAMRGGVFVDNYRVDVTDLLDFVRTRNRPILAAQASFFDALASETAGAGTIDYGALRARAAATGSASLERLVDEYLPLAFSRRHGDPSRPWNQFSINLKKPDGSRRLDYQGNWRDIFQNWEALLWSYPDFVEGVIAKFVNATTLDGYNPYRVTRDGIEWEAPAPEDPWANIGYWSDHQIIYLQKLLEISARVHPGRLDALLSQRIFSHANVPYRIKPYAALLADPYDTITFDADLDAEIASTVATMGTDGKLVLTDGATWRTHGVRHVTLLEKLLILVLTKLGNLVPEGGIWMNTQRPEWNDANNALVGKGLSVVTTAYLRRTLAFVSDLVSVGAADSQAEALVTAEVHQLLSAMDAVLRGHAATLAGSFTDAERRAVMDGLGQASSDYRWSIYDRGVSEEFVPLATDSLMTFLELALQYVEHTLRANRRPDGLYHAYNVLHLGDGTAAVDHLYEMLEGQVAVLSSGMLSSEESLALLHALRRSAMYRADQHSYMLYPDRDLPGFLQKNRMSEAQVAGLQLVAKLVEAGDRTLVTRDEDGVYHFSGAFRNARDVARALADIEAREAVDPAGDPGLVAAESQKILDLFEEVFRHSQFTGRSGTFFAYEGLGSIYWHMVSKLLLVAEESYLHAVSEGADRDVQQALLSAYYAIRHGLGFNKSPAEYGAFPTDPYSHTPAGQGAKQPGMTGLVKEEILARWGELGVTLDNGTLGFVPAMLRQEEFLEAPAQFTYVDLEGKSRVLDLPAGALAFTYCQVPVVYLDDGGTGVDVHYADGTSATVAGSELPVDISASVFGREGRVKRLVVHVGLTP